jgi:hypothetical protein
MEKTIPNQDCSKAEEGEASTHAQGKKKTPEKGRAQFLETIHGPLVGYREITSLFYDYKSTIKVSIGYINLYEGYNLGCKQPQEKYPG